MKRKSGASVRKWDGRPFRVLAFDPGGTTGWAMATLIHEDAKSFVYHSGQIGPEEHHLRLYNFMTNGWSPVPSELVCESFEYRNMSRKGLELVSKEYIGIIKFFSEQTATPLTFHTASAAKTFVPDDKIKALDLWTPGQPHAMDSMRHLLRYLVIGKGIREPITNKWLEM